MSDHTLWLEVEEEGRIEHTRTQQRHQRWPEPCIGNGKSELSLLGKLFIQLYPSSPSTAAMILQLLDETAGLTLAPAPAVATVRQVSRLAPAPAAATVPQQSTFSVPPFSIVCSHKGVVDYLASSRFPEQLILVHVECYVLASECTNLHNKKGDGAVKNVVGDWPALKLGVGFALHFFQDSMPGTTAFEII